jgi:hypothetical protein
MRGASNADVKRYLHVRWHRLRLPEEVGCTVMVPLLVQPTSYSNTCHVSAVNDNAHDQTTRIE